MAWNQPSRIRHFSALAGCGSSLLTLVAAFVMFTIPRFTPVGLLVAAFLSAVVLSLPVWATGLAISLYTGRLNGHSRLNRAMQVSALASLGFFLFGLLGTVAQIPGRTVGDALYLIGILFLLTTAIVVLLIEWHPSYFCSLE